MKYIDIIYLGLKKIYCILTLKSYRCNIKTKKHIFFNLNSYKCKNYKKGVKDVSE